MCADGYAAFECRSYGKLHPLGITRMESTGDVGRGDILEELVIRRSGVVSRQFTQIAIQVNRPHIQVVGRRIARAVASFFNWFSW